MVSQLASGSCVALEIMCTDSSKCSYEEFRKFCGPMDPVSIIKYIYVEIYH